MEPFHAKLKRLIDERFPSQAKFAEKAGTNPAQVSRWCNAELEPNVFAALRMARALGVPLGYLADDAMEQPAPPTEARRSIERLIAQVGEEEALARLEMSYLRVGAPAEEAGRRSHLGHAIIPVQMVEVPPGAGRRDEGGARGRRQSRKLTADGIPGSGSPWTSTKHVATSGRLSTAFNVQRSRGQSRHRDPSPASQTR